MKKNNHLVSIIKKHIQKNTSSSHVLAKSIQESTLSNLLSNSHKTNNRGVKAAGYRVLLRSKIAALVEVGFITDKKEESLLVTNSYQNLIAQGIANGIKKYIKIPSKKPMRQLTVLDGIN